MRKDTTIIRPRCNATVSYIILIPREKASFNPEALCNDNEGCPDPSRPSVLLPCVGPVSFERCRGPTRSGDIVGCESPTWVLYISFAHLLEHFLQYHDSTFDPAPGMG